MRLFMAMMISCCAACVVFSVDLPTTTDAAYKLLTPYTGKSIPGVDRSTLTSKVTTGYQGWFNTPSDGAGRGWVHYGKQGKFSPGFCHIDIWPAVDELPPADRFDTGFKKADGSAAQVFSSYRRDTVLTHFKWMSEYGIEVAFLQRFANEVRNPRSLHHRNTVLSHVRESANRYGRGYVLMYDLSGLKSDSIQAVSDDWKQLVDHMKLSRDKGDRAYQHHHGKPVVALWGIGFNDDRGYSLADCEKLIDFFKNDPTYGGNTVMIGVPYYWREQKHDATKDDNLHRILKKADIISPWAVGRFDNKRTADNIATKTIAPDMAWCRQEKVEYLPVVWPGFSWHNLRDGKTQFDQIPRQSGQFLWEQIKGLKQGGANMIYVAMFDELDEGTAIFKCDPKPPPGDTPFLTESTVPSDHYLWLCGQAGRLLRGELTETTMPKR